MFLLSADQERGMRLRDTLSLVEKLDPERVALVRRERPYRIPKGFVSWDILSRIVAVSLRHWQAKNPVDQATWLNCARTALWFVQAAPIYCLSTSLLRSFEQTAVEEHPELLVDLNPPLPTFMLLFPQNSIHTPDGVPLDYCVVHLADAEHPERSEGEAWGYTLPYLKHEHQRNLHWSSIDQEEICWFSGIGLEQDGRIKSSDTQLGSAAISPTESDFLRRMRSVVLQCLLALTYRPDLLEDQQQPPQQQQPTRSRARQRSDRGQQPMYPRWIGKDYQRPSERPSASLNAGLHGSPRPHWRKGHWRRVAVGPRQLDQRKWIWVEPTFVGAKKY